MNYMVKHVRANLIFLALCAVMIAIALGVDPVAAQSTEPKTVADFFRLVPERYIGYDLAFREGLLGGERRGTVIDIPNGFISWDASDNPEEFEFAIFKKNNGKYLAAFSVGYDSQFPQASRFVLLSYERGRWRDVTRASLPVAYNRRLTYKLPRQGRTIEVWDENGHQPYLLTWANDRFRIKRSSVR